MGIGLAIIVLVIFQAGIFVGYKKASFSYRWGDNYSRNFGGRMNRPFMGMIRGEFSNAHGTIGKIIKIDLPTFVIESNDNIEKIIVLKNDTIIKKFRETIKPEDLKDNDSVVIIGSPDSEGKIEAKLIRLMPMPPIESK